MQVLGLVQQVGGPAQGLDARRLGHAAHPRWRAAAEVEQVLPGDEAPAPGHTERVHLVEQLAQGVRIAFRLVPHAEAVQGVGLLEGGQRVDLQPLAGEVLEQDLAAPEAHLVACRRVGQAAPVLAVAPDLQEGRRHARGAEQASESERLDRVHHVAQLSVAGAGERAQRTHPPDVCAPPASAVACRDRVLVDRSPQGAVDRPPGPPAAAGGASLCPGAGASDRGRPGAGGGGAGQSGKVAPALGRAQRDLGAGGHGGIVNPLGGRAVDDDHGGRVGGPADERRHQEGERQGSRDVPHPGLQRE